MSQSKPTILNMPPRKSSPRPAVSKWFAERFSQLFRHLGMSEDLDSGWNLYEAGKVIDITVAPGQISVKIAMPSGKFQSLMLSFRMFSIEEVEGVFKEISKDAFCFAKLLAGDVPFEVEESFNSVDSSLVPVRMHHVSLTTDCPAVDRPLALSAFYWALLGLLEKDTFTLFVIRGIGREEALSRLRRHRAESRKDVDLVPEKASLPEVKVSPKDFWKCSPEVLTQKFAIKADELPAALLRRLDTLPLLGLEDVLDRQLEDAYETVAKRAHAYGLGMK